MDTIKKEKFLVALLECHGIVTEACSKIGIKSTSTVYNEIKKCPEFAEEIELVREGACDFVEKKLFENIEKGFETSIIFFLKTRGRSRGYAEKLTLEDDRLENVNINFRVHNG